MEGVALYIQHRIDEEPIRMKVIVNHKSIRILMEDRYIKILKFYDTTYCHGVRANDEQRLLLSIARILDNGISVDIIIDFIKSAGGETEFYHPKSYLNTKVIIPRDT